jgi:hypothetical protein
LPTLSLHLTQIATQHNTTGERANGIMLELSIGAEALQKRLPANVDGMYIHTCSYFSLEEFTNNKRTKDLSVHEKLRN